MKFLSDVVGQFQPITLKAKANSIPLAHRLTIIFPNNDFSLALRYDGTESLVIC